jgi:type I restriction-modification system DNA methylase subunit
LVVYTEVDAASQLNFLRMSRFPKKAGREPLDSYVFNRKQKYFKKPQLTRSREFDFMLSNPPYGKSWKSDLDRMGGKKEIKDPRFVIQRDDDPEYSLLTSSGDGQMLFLAIMLSR